MFPSWRKGDLTVKVLFSIPAIATQVVISAESVGFDLLLDCGCSALRDLLLDYYRDSKEFDRLKAILISHEHFDHVGGLYSLMDYMHVYGRVEPLTILTPKPSLVARHFIETLMEFRGGKLAYSIKLVEVEDQEELQLGPLRVKAFKVLHRGSTKTEPIGPPIPAMGYTINYKGLRVVYSGDTGICNNLMEEVRGADLAILEATWTEGKGIPGIHLSVDEAAKLGETAKDYILIHRGSLRKQLLKGG
ncbi:MAG: ribonuclease Z [archaeon GB-1867-005]|nr:ribonuclease Z [Candidatus Culexmicrobium cathedralense]